VTHLKTILERIYVTHCMACFPIPVVTYILRINNTNKLFSKTLKITTKILFILIISIIFYRADFIFSLIVFTKMADTVTKICMDTYRKLEISRVLNIIEDLQIPDILEICYFIIYYENMSKNIYQSRHRFFFCVKHPSLHVIMNSLNERCSI
jgi:hypothetical protein